MPVIDHSLDVSDLRKAILPLADDLELFRGASIMVTGGTGIIGKWILSSLLYAEDTLKLGLSITVLSRSPSSFSIRFPELFNHSALRFVKGDVTSFNKDLVSGRHEYVIHGATDVVNVAGGNETLQTCYLGTKNMIDVARGIGCRRFLLLSSGAVYGKTGPSVGAIPEDYIGPLDFNSSQSSYANGKRLSELLCSLSASDGSIEFVTARCFAMVGPYLPLDKHFAIGNFINACFRKEDIIIKGDGSPVRSYLYMADVSRFLLTILLRGISGEAYNVGSGSPISIGALAELTRKVLCADVSINKINNSYSEQHSDVYYPSVDKLAAFGLRPSFDLEQAILRTSEWLSR
jgi:nucleoside-diphosphate-sugar epimerase